MAWNRSRLWQLCAASGYTTRYCPTEYTGNGVVPPGMNRTLNMNRSMVSDLLLVNLCALVCIFGCDIGKSPGDPAADAVTPKAPVEQLESLTFGIVPQQSASKLARLWIPIMQKVGEDAGVKLVFQTAKDIPEFEKRCRDGDYKVAYMNPFHYTQFHEDPGYHAVAKQKGKLIQGILVARKGSGLRENLTDLNGKTLAFPAPDAFAATKIPTRELGDMRPKIEVKPEYVSSHDSVYRAVAQGLYIAGGGIRRTLNNVEPSVSAQLEVIMDTDKYTPHAFAIHPDVDAETRKRIAQALISLGDSEEGRALLAGIKFDGIEAAEDSEWHDVRGLNMDPINFED